MKSRMSCYILINISRTVLQFDWHDISSVPYNRVKYKLEMKYSEEKTAPNPDENWKPSLKKSLNDLHNEELNCEREVRTWSDCENLESGSKCSNLLRMRNAGSYLTMTPIFRAETMVCFTAFSLKADQMPIFGLLLVFFLLKSLHFMNFPQNDDW